MPRQKLPDGWVYSPVYADSIEHISGWPEASVVRDDNSLMVEERNSTACLPIASALAVIRNAGQDRVYELVKELFAADSYPVDTDGKRIMDELAKLIDSLEETE